MSSIFEHRVIFWDQEFISTSVHKLVGEEPLSIRIQGKPYSVVMRTPGDEIAHVAGFCLGEGIVDAPEDIASVAFCDDLDTNVVTVTLKSHRVGKIPGHLDRRAYISQTGCGLCGKTVIEELHQLIKPVEKSNRLDIKNALACLDTLSLHQQLRHKTYSTHAAAIYSSDFKLLAVAEDVGRHNALDKAVGKTFLKHRLPEAALLILSSRISYELVQKAARARIPVIFAISRPTALAVQLASKLHMALACLAKGGGLYIFCGEHRLSGLPAVPKKS